MEAHDSPPVEVRDFGEPDDLLETPLRVARTLKFGRGHAILTRIEPGWSFRKDFQPHVGTQWCQIDHFEYVISGQLSVVTAEGQAYDVKPGDVMAIPPGHEGRVVGDKPFITISLARREP